MTTASTHLTTGAALREEFIRLHGELPPYDRWLDQLPDHARLWRFQRDHFKNLELLLRQLRDNTNPAARFLRERFSDDARQALSSCDVSEPACETLCGVLAVELNRVVSCGRCIYNAQAFEGIPLTPELQARLKGLAEEGSAANPGGDGLRSARAIEIANRLLLESAFPGSISRVWDTMAAAIWISHRRPRTALCFSGGGIRSATFNLGVLQGLARLGLLGQFDYLSTVSGGGYIGSWLSSWIHHTRRRGGSAEDVFRALAREEPCSPTEPEPRPIRHLRQFSNYLTPKLGLFSADTWTLIGTYLRNLFLNWLVFLPLIMATLALPRLAVPLLQIPWSTGALTGWFIAGFVFATVSIAFAVMQRPALHERLRRNSRFWPRHGDQSGFLTWCFTPMLVSAGCFIVFWAGFTQDAWEMPHWWTFAAGGAGLHFSGWVLSRVVLRSWRWRELGGVLLTGAIGGGLLWYGAAQAFTNLDYAPELELYVVLALPVFLNVFLITATVFIGLTSRFTTDNDREWWARVGAWYLIGLVAWGGFSALSLFGPELLLALPGWISMLGGLPGLFAVFVGFNQQTSATREASAEAGLKEKVLNLGLSLAAPVFLVFLGAALSLLTTVLLGLTPSLDGLTHRNLVHQTPLWLAATVVAGGLFFGIGLSHWINVNRFSLHSVYRNRLIRAYLGASNPRREPNPFTGFDPRDNLRLDALAGQRPLPVVNMALNLVGGDNLAWQQRQAESFTATTLHAGSLGLGYRPVAEYAASRWLLNHPPVAASTGPSTPLSSHESTSLPSNGLSLGTAVTISGAAASPNMGYHSSPIVALLLTLFNARLGAWLGNPGPAGEKSFNTPAPGSGVLYMIKEALGLTNDSSPYVYLSDGGHFENLGLYEMVLRRCRFIVVSDAGCDPSCRLEDLGNAIRKIRIDLGVPIVMDRFNIRARDGETTGKHCSVGAIHYDHVDGPDAQPGVLVYLKPSLSGDEPRDVFNYAKCSPKFPHEPTSDQWFSETQFESYRALGQHIMGELAYDWSGVRTREPEANPLAAFIRQTYAYLDMSIPPQVRDRLRELETARAGLEIAARDHQAPAPEQPSF